MASQLANYATSVSTNITICQVRVGVPPANLSNAQFSCPGIIDLAHYYISAGSTGVGTVLTFQEMMPDGVTWNPLVSPAPITLANSTNYNGILNGPAFGFRISISTVVGNGVATALIVATVRLL